MRTDDKVLITREDYISAIVELLKILNLCQLKRVYGFVLMVIYKKK